MLWPKVKLSQLFSSKPFGFDPDVWQKKLLSLDDVADKIPNGSHLYIGSTAATAHTTLSAIVNSSKQLLDINILQFIPGGELPHLDANLSSMRTTAFFAYAQTAQNIQQGITDYVPVSSSRMYRLIKERRIPIDVAIVKISPPNEQGFCSLGTGVDFSREAIKAADIVIAEVNPNMPRTRGNSLIHVEKITWWINNDKPMPSTKELFPKMGSWKLDKAVLDRIAENVVFEIPDGATIKLDLTILTNNLVPYLSKRKNLGLHTDLFTDQMLQLIKSGVITNSEKNVNTGKSIVCHAFGSKELMDYVNDNPEIEFHSSYHVNRLDKMAVNNNLISIVTALKVDLTGQVAVDSVGYRFYAGIGSADDSIRAAGFSYGGKPIVALPSKSVKGNSNIMFALPEGTGVVVTRLDVHYVITEYGTASLFGKSIRERCLALIDIAHPDFREQLLQQAKDSLLIHAQQPGHSFTSQYPKQLECMHSTHSGQPVLIRPIKAVDEDLLRAFFHKLSDQNVYMRYFAQVRSLPQKVLKQFSDIDYSKDMALVALSPPETANHEIVAIGQWIMDEEDNIPEIAFQVRDDWQGEGLGKFFVQRLFDIAKQYDIKQLKADVLEKNAAMNRVFEELDLKYQRKKEFGVFTYYFEL